MATKPKIAPCRGTTSENEFDFAVLKHVALLAIVKKVGTDSGLDREEEEGPECQYQKLQAAVRKVMGPQVFKKLDPT